MKKYWAVMAGIMVLGAWPQCTMAEDLVTDRPDFTESALTVSPRVLQIEGGYTLENSSQTVGEVLLRYGVTDKMELRFEFPSYTITSDQKGFSDSSVGFKYSLLKATETEKLKPETAIILLTSLPTGSPEFKEADLQLTAKVCLGWEIWSLGGTSMNLNYGYLGSGEGRFGQWAGSVSQGIEINDQWGAYLEYYGFFPSVKNGDPQHTVNTGLTYLFSSDVQADIRMGQSLGTSDWFVGVGMATRMML